MSGVSGRIPGSHSCPYFQKLPGLEGRGRPGDCCLFVGRLSGAARLVGGAGAAGGAGGGLGRWRLGWGSPCSSPLSSAPLLLVSLADAAARGGGSSRGTRGRERG